jgi:hypothetical protein
MMSKLLMPLRGRNRFGQVAAMDVLTGNAAEPAADHSPRNLQ